MTSSSPTFRLTNQDRKLLAINSLISVSTQGLLLSDTVDEGVWQALEQGEEILDPWTTVRRVIVGAQELEQFFDVYHTEIAVRVGQVAIVVGITAANHGHDEHRERVDVLGRVGERLRHLVGECERFGRRARVVWIIDGLFVTYAQPEPAQQLAENLKPLGSVNLVSAVVIGYFSRLLTKFM